VIRTARSLDELETDAWDALTRNNLHMSRPWLSSTEFVGTTSPFYTLTADDDSGEPVAAMSCHLVKGGFPFQDPRCLLLGENLSMDLESFRDAEAEGAFTQWREIFLSEAGRSDSADLVCMAPFAFAVGLQVDGTRRSKTVSTTAMIETAGRISADENALLTIFLYVADSDSALTSALEAAGYRKMRLPSRCVLHVRWASLDAYVDSFGHHRRTRLRHELRVIRSGDVTFEEWDIDRVRAGLSTFADLSAKVQEKYGHGYHPDRERATLETITTSYSEFTRAVVARRDEVVIAFHLYYDFGAGIYAGLVGQDHELARGTYAHFGVLYYSILQKAIESGKEFVDFGIEAYAAKVGRGASVVPLAGYFRGNSDRIHECIERLTAVNDAAYDARLQHLLAR
jgi:predicted N-acyltransferase